MVGRFSHAERFPACCALATGVPSNLQRRVRTVSGSRAALTVDRYVHADAEWDAFVRAQPGWTSFHLAGWARVFEDVFGHATQLLAARRPDGGLDGVLPLTEVRSPWFGHFLVSMPFLNYGGPLGSDAAIQQLTAAAVALAADSGADLLELRSRRALPVDLHCSHRKITVVLDLPPSQEQLLAQFGSKLRNQVHRAAREGVTVRFGRDQVAPFYRVFAAHMRDLGTPVMPERFFDAVAATFGDEVCFGCAWKDGRPIAAGAGFRWDDEFELSWASSLRAYNRIAPNMRLYHAFLERCIDGGVRQFNFGRCSPGSGTHRFKQQWGGRDEPLWWYDAGPKAETGTPSPTASAYRWGPRVWRHLPLWAANSLGPHIVRSIP